MARIVIKEKTARYLEVTNPTKAVGLWSHHVERKTGMKPIGKTREALGRFIHGDIARWETFAEAKAALEAKDALTKGKPHSASQKLKEYAAQFLGERFDEAGEGEWMAVPRWFRVWWRFATWLSNTKTATRGPDVRMSFDAPHAGHTCHEGNLHTGRTFFMRTKPQASGAKYTYFVAVVLKPGGTQWWNQIDKTNVTWTDHVYERLVIDPRGGYSWGPILADVIDERVAERDICLFQLEPDELFETITDPAVNGREQYCHLSTDFDFFVHDPNGPEERYYLKWAATFNPKRAKYDSCKRTHITTIEIARERKFPWAKHPIEVTQTDQLPKAVREVVRTNGCLLLPSNASDELRLAADHALFFVTFPDRKPDEAGGLLRGYQIPGRMYYRAEGKVRGDIMDVLIQKRKVQSSDTLTRKRALVVETLLNRAARVVAQRNGLAETDAKAKIEAVDGRVLLETAAWEWGMMEGQPIILFTASPTAGSLKLPDLSLALAFEHKLGLDGSKGTLAPLVQTARMRDLTTSIGCVRCCIGGAYTARRIGTPYPGGEKVPVEYPMDSIRILREEGRYYLMAIPRYGRYVYDRDLAYDQKNEKSVPVEGFRCVTDEGVRSRQDLHIKREVFEWNKINRLAQEGRLYLYALDFGKDKWVADATYTLENVTPCVFVTTIPQLVNADGKPPLAMDETASVKMMFTINPCVIREGRKVEGRSWRNYCDAYPDEAKRSIFRWPVQGELKDVVRACAEQDGVLLTDREHFPEVLAAMSYVVLPGRAPTAPGGLYRGYMLRDRVFTDIDNRAQFGRVSLPLASNGRAGSMSPLPADSTPKSRAKYERERFLERKGKLLVEIVQPETAKQLEQDFIARIEADPLADKKSSKYFTLAEPLRITADLAPLVAREFRRVVYTGTMKYQQQIIRPAHEVALGIWLIGLKPESNEERRSLREAASVPKQKLDPHTEKRLAELDQLLADGLITPAEHAAQHKRITGKD